MATAVLRATVWPLGPAANAGRCEIALLKRSTLSDLPCPNGCVQSRLNASHEATVTSPAALDALHMMTEPSALRNNCLDYVSAALRC